MTCRQPIISAIAILAVLGAAACSSKKDLAYAKRSLYDADFIQVYQAAVAATREAYPNLEDYPGKGVVKTMWHQVTYATSSDDMAQTRAFAPTAGGMGMNPNAPMGAGGQPTRLAYKRFYVRFDVSVVGGRPWRVKVVGQASEWEPGNAMPTELRGPARPPWLDGRIDALTLAIYKRIKQYAVPMPDEPKEESKEVVLPKTDPKAFAGLPAGAAAQLAPLKDAIERRDYELLRARVASDVVWSLGGSPGIDTALALWQADPEPLDAMGRAITEGCAAATPTRVTCPAGAQAPGAWQLVLEERAGAWKVTSFTKAD